MVMNAMQYMLNKKILLTIKIIEKMIFTEVLISSLRLSGLFIYIKDSC